jgi:hypothetical protein
MKAFPLFFGFGQVERNAWDFMVNIPSPFAIVIPRHSVFELGLDVLNQLLSATSYQVKRMVGFLLTFEDEKKSPTKVGENTVLRVFPMLNCKSLFYLLNVLLVGGVMAVTIGAFYAHLSVVGISMIKMSQIFPQVPCVFLGPLFMLGLSAFFAFAIIVTAVEIELVQRLVCLALSFTRLLVHTYKCGLSRGKCEKTEDLTFYRSVLH